MGVWASLAAAVLDLRTFLNDGPTDRPVKQKVLVGQADGTNAEFQLYEERIVVGSVVITVDFTPQPFTLTDPIMGIVTMATPPAGGAVVRGRYYYQWFLDSELQTAIQNACTQAAGSDDPTTIPPELKVVVLNYGGYFGYKKQAIRWSQRMSEKYLLQDAPLQAETMQHTNEFNKMAKTFMDEARILRDDFYKGQSRQLAPAAAMFKPRVSRTGPRT